MTLDETQPRAKQAHSWERDQFDWYVEGPEVTEALLRVERFVGPVWDPACGQGNICAALMKAGHLAYGTDIVARGAGAISHGWSGVWDFLADDAWLNDIPNVCTNPPFYRAKGAEAFIRKALKHATGKVAVFCDIRFLASGRRARGLYAEHPPHRIWILADRPSCPPGEYLKAGGKAANGTSDWCWLIFDNTAPRPVRSEIGWLVDEVVA